MYVHRLSCSSNCLNCCSCLLMSLLASIISFIDLQLYLHLQLSVQLSENVIDISTFFFGFFFGFVGLGIVDRTIVCFAFIDDRVDRVEMLLLRVLFFICYVDVYCREKCCNCNGYLFSFMASIWIEKH